MRSMMVRTGRSALSSVVCGLVSLGGAGLDYQRAKFRMLSPRIKGNKMC